jgi:hypothetical protein
MKMRTILLGLGAFLLALLVVMPASWMAPLLPAQVQCAAWRGSIWSGQCAGLSLAMTGTAPVKLETLRWKMHPQALLHLGLNADFQLSAAQGNATGQMELGRAGRLMLQGVSLQVPFDRRFVSMLPAGWTGQLEARQLELRLQGKQILGLSGELLLRNLDDGHGSALGSYRLVFAPRPAAPFIGTLRDDGGPLAVAASLTVATDRSWVLDGTVATRGNTGEALKRNLDLLGAPDASGQRRLSAAGSFN